MATSEIHLGYEIGTGDPVAIPLKNCAVTGQTQESGKTTALEALVSRAAVPSLAFVTKRGESAFAGGNRVQPYFRDRADWQFVTSILDATLQEKNKFLRPWIIKICRTTRTLADVQRAVRTALKDARGIHEGVYTQLDAYLDLIVPEIEHAPLAQSLALRDGLNVMDVSAYPTPMQMLFVQSAIDWINDNEKHVVTIIPEAWEMIPEGRGSPVKASAIALVRKGSGIGNHIWVDSQDMAGVDKTILRGCPVWLIGVQREANEIKRNLSNIPAGIKKPSPLEIARLDRGQFYACWKDRIVKVYVQPTWMGSFEAIGAAKGLFAPKLRPQIQKTEEHVSPQEANRLTKDNEELRAKNAELLKIVEQLRLESRQTQPIKTQQVPDGWQKPEETKPPTQPAPPATQTNGSRELNEDALFDRFKSRLIAEVPGILRVMTVRPELDIEVTRRTLEAHGDTLRGRIGLLISKGFFEMPKPGTAIENELRRQGFACSRPNCYREADKLAADGFFTKEDGGYQAVPGMKVNVIEV